MEKVKNFIKNNKKIVIPVAVLLVLLLVVGIYFTSQPSVESDKRGDRYTEEKIEISKEESKTEDQKKDESKGETSSNSSAKNSDGSSTNSLSANTGHSVSNGSSNSSKTSNPTHQHSWKEHTAKKWVENIVTIVDQPERYEKYTLYRMYWYNTGTWEETRDPSRFKTWSRDRVGGQLAPNSQTMVSNPEDCPLFTGYNEHGQPTFTGDHAIISGLYDKIPAVTHQEDHGHYETYVDYQYCDCGAKK